jgi:hypothetical protein
MPSRLGEVEPLEPAAGAMRFAAPAVKTSKRQNAKTQKHPVTIRLPLDVIARISALGHSLRQDGARARQVSASEIVEAAVRSLTPEGLRGLLLLDETSGTEKS